MGLYLSFSRHLPHQFNNVFITHGNRSLIKLCKTYRITVHMQSLENNGLNADGQNRDKRFVEKKDMRYPHIISSVGKIGRASFLSFKCHGVFYLIVVKLGQMPPLVRHVEKRFHLVRPKVRKSEGSLVRRFVSQK